MRHLPHRYGFTEVCGLFLRTRESSSLGLEDRRLSTSKTITLERADSGMIKSQSPFKMLLALTTLISLRLRSKWTKRKTAIP
jgi:hypothetical protein